MLFSYKMFTFYEANTLVALPNAWLRSVRALSLCYYNNNGSESTDVKTVELSNLFSLYEPPDLFAFSPS
jgi:hypothetical protein